MREKEREPREREIKRERELEREITIGRELERKRERARKRALELLERRKLAPGSSI